MRNGCAIAVAIRHPIEWYWTMQNRYVGDIGDYCKLGILRALTPGFDLGVAWWLFPDETHNGDGRHTTYLSHPHQWRHFDPDLFDSLHRIVSSGQRNVCALEATGMLPGATFASEFVPTGGPVVSRVRARSDWLNAVSRKLDAADLLLLDPDNGLEPAGYRPSGAKSGKSIMLRELRSFARPGRCLIVYHHQSRRLGGHRAEMRYLADRLRTYGFTMVDALRARPFSPRLYFLLDAPPIIRRRAEQLAVDWPGCIMWHPDCTIGTVEPMIDRPVWRPRADEAYLDWVRLKFGNADKRVNPFGADRC
jgi:hypothetical protein